MESENPHGPADGSRKPDFRTRGGATQVERGIGAEARRWIRSLGPVNEPLRAVLKVDQIRNPELPRSLRGYEVVATQALLEEIAEQYERLLAEREELRRRLDDLEAASPSADDRDLLAAERDELWQRVAELEAEADGREDHEVLAAERDRLRARVGELEALADGRKDYDEVVSARARLEVDVAELQELLSTRDDYEAIVAERDDLRGRLTEAEVPTETDHVLSRALLAASRAADELVQEAQTEAEAILAAAQGSVAAAERGLEERRRALESERDAYLEALRVEALQAAREDLVALQQEAEPLVRVLGAFTRRIRAIVQIQLDAPEQEPPGELLDDLQARTESSGAEQSPAESD